jgi:hypothetical protein
MSRHLTLISGSGFEKRRSLRISDYGMQCLKTAQIYGRFFLIEQILVLSE